MKFEKPYRLSRRAFALLLLVTLACAPLAGTFGQTRPPTPGAASYSRRASREALKWADDELKRMTVEEKIGQLISVGINARFLNQESEEYKALRRQVEQNHVGGIILFRGPVYESVHLINRMQGHARRPLLISAD